MNMETYTLWLMPCNMELFPFGLPTFNDPDLRIRYTIEAQDDFDSIGRVAFNQLRKQVLSGYHIAWKIDRGGNQDPLDAKHQVWSDVCKLSCEEAILVMGGPEKAFNTALENCWLGLALTIAMIESMKRNDPEWDNRKRIVQQNLRQETDTLISKGWPQGKIAAWLRVAPDMVR